MNLNPGGIIGGLLGAVAAAVIVFGLMGSEHHRGKAKLVILGVGVGALAGNFLWGIATGSRNPVPESDPGDEGPEDDAPRVAER